MAEYEWDPEPPTIKQRLLAIAYGGILLFTTASQLFGWRVFGEYDKQVSTAWTILGIVLFFLFMPGVRRNAR